jgi:hypothetical protein
MKITQTDTQLEIKSSGIGQAIIGFIMVVGGTATAVLLPGATDDRGQQVPGWVVLIGLAVAIVGVAFIFFAKNRRITIQHGGNTEITAKRIIGGGHQTQTITTASIVAVRLSTYVESTSDPDGGVSGGNPASSRRSVLSLVLNNNDLVELGNSGGNNFNINGLSIGGLISKAPLSKEANQLATFLGVPLQADDTSSIAGALRSVKNAFGQQASQPPTQSPSLNPTQPPLPSAPPTNPAPQPPTPPQNPVAPQQ